MRQAPATGPAVTLHRSRSSIYRAAGQPSSMMAWSRSPVKLTSSPLTTKGEPLGSVDELKCSVDGLCGGWASVAPCSAAAEAGGGGSPSAACAAGVALCSTVPAGSGVGAKANRRRGPEARRVSSNASDMSVSSAVSRRRSYWGSQ